MRKFDEHPALFSRVFASGEVQSLPGKLSRVITSLASGAFTAREMQPRRLYDDAKIRYATRDPDAREPRASSARDAVLEHVTCAVCGGKDYDVVLEAQYENEKDVDLIQKFRASGDELLIDRLVRCRDCGLQYINPRLRGDLIFSSYAEGEDPVYVSQMEARERTFAASLAQIEQLRRAAGDAPRHRHRGGRLSRGRDRGAAGRPKAASRTAGSRHGARSSTASASGPAASSSSLRAGELRRRHALGRHRAHDRTRARCIEHCRTLLKPGGVLVVNYPDIGSWIARALGRRWLFLTSVHLHYFDRGTMTRLLESAGFEVAGHPPALPAARARLHPLAGRGAQQAVGGRSAWDRQAARPRRAARCRTGSGQTFVAARRK